MKRKRSGMKRERREKMFGLGRTRALDRNTKVRIMHWARCLARRMEKCEDQCKGAGRARGASVGLPQR
jgi:hypothetical protein